jgi:hypothetical protein
MAPFSLYENCADEDGRDPLSSGRDGTQPALAGVGAATIVVVRCAERK